jgi:hypothetical protein
MQSQILFQVVIPITSVLGRIPVVPVGETGAIQYSMRKEGNIFPRATCDTKRDSAEDYSWWYINTWALKWATS